MYFTGIIIAVCTFLTIGIWHPIVIKTEYYWGTRPWVVYLVIGLASIMGALFIEIEEFYMLPQNGRLYKYDRMAINVIVDNIKGGLSFCDVAVSDDMETFNAHYLHLTETIRQTCQDILDDGAVIVGTSAVTGTELDSIVNQYRRFWVLKVINGYGINSERNKKHKRF